MSTGCALLLEILFALLFPPLGVCLRYGCCTVEFLICLLLTLLGFLPGIIYALYAEEVVNPDRDDYRGRYYTLA
ncbi:hydrophobic protein OSR8-like isoform X2 [Bidens hawaiensis]|uniref:hydrophobic protein OSR8-like isoform X2 n=1 Tax=Bidens hawaiensis TaxID=980011 RepID=UPI00404A740E